MMSVFDLCYYYWATLKASSSSYRLPSLLVNRLVLNLRNFDRKSRARETKLNTTTFPQIQFDGNGWLGNIGGPLDYSQWEHDLDNFPQEGLGSEEQDVVSEDMVDGEAAVNRGTGSSC